MVYDQGPQWGYISPQSGSLSVNHLRTIIDPQRSDVRVAINQIHSTVKQFESRLSPQRIDAYLRPRTGSVEDATVAQVGGKLLERTLTDIDALSVMREMNPTRLVLGTGIVRRTMKQVGQVIQTPDGAPIRNLKVGWANCYPFEIIRDPASTTMRPERDEIDFAQEKPRTTHWIKRNFGIEVTTDSTLGLMLDYQRQIKAATGMSPYGAALDSKLKAVLVYEAYFQDEDDPGDWPWMLFGYSDPKAQGQEIIPLWYGKNPFFGLPYTFFAYDQPVNSPWGAGIPHFQREGQDVFNLALTWMMRVMREGAGRWRYLKGTVENPSKQFTNRIDVPLEWTWAKTYPQNTPAPERTAPPQLPPTANVMLANAPSWIQNAVNFSDVQRGAPGSKRGEAAAAYEIRLKQADSPIENIRVNDEMALSRLLFGTWVDIASPDKLRLDQARDILGPDMPDEHIRMLLRRPPTEPISEVVVKPTTMRPMTPAETKQDFTGLASSRVIEPVDAQWEMLLQGNVNTNTLMYQSYWKQMSEIQSMKSGRPAQPTVLDEHDFHMKTIEIFVSTPEWHTLGPEIQDEIQKHYLGHIEAKQAEAGLEAMGSIQPATGGPMGGTAPVMSGSMAPAGARIKTA